MNLSGPYGNALQRMGGVQEIRRHRETSENIANAVASVAGGAPPVQDVIFQSLVLDDLYEDAVRAAPLFQEALTVVEKELRTHGFQVTVRQAPMKRKERRNNA